MKKVAVILLTFKRINLLKNTLDQLYIQTYKNFDLYISHGDKESKDKFESIIKNFSENLSIKSSIDINDKYAFRRYDIARKIYHQYDIILFLDDDVTIPKTYIESCVNQYKEKSYLSSHTYSFTTDPANYDFRKKYNSKSNYIVYGGAGVSVIDPSIFKYNYFYESEIIKNNYKFDDIWLSYYVSKLGWSINYLDAGAILGGDDDVALFKNIWPEKNIFLQKLINAGWIIKRDIS